MNDASTGANDRDEPHPESQAMDISRDNDSIWCSRRCAQFAEAAGFGKTALWEIAIAVSELVTNVLKYAGRGQITIRRIAEPTPGIEISVEDEGPGIEDPAQVVVDGYSEWRGGTPRPEGQRRSLGAGLGAVHRLMDQVQIDNRTEGGARVVARKLLDPAGRSG